MIFRTEKRLFLVFLYKFVDMLKERLSSTDIRQVKADVMPFVRNPHDLDIWSNDYFLQLAGMVKYA